MTAKRTSRRGPAPDDAPEAPPEIDSAETLEAVAEETEATEPEPEPEPEPEAAASALEAEPAEAEAPAEELDADLAAEIEAIADSDADADADGDAPAEPEADEALAADDAEADETDPEAEPAPGAPSAGEPVRLHRRARHDETDELLAWLRAAPAGAPLTLDASEVDNLSTPYVLAIVAAARARAEAGEPAVVTSPSPAFVDAFSDLGLFGDLMKMEIRA